MPQVPDWTGDAVSKAKTEAEEYGWELKVSDGGSEHDPSAEELAKIVQHNAQGSEPGTFKGDGSLVGVIILRDPGQMPPSLDV